MEKKARRGLLSRTVSVALIVAMLTAALAGLPITASAAPPAAASTFEPIDPAEWGEAQWIWNGADATAANTWMSFRRDFTLEAVPAAAEIKVASDSKYWLWVNGVEAVWEGSLIRGATGPSHSANANESYGSVQTSPAADSTYYDTVDIAPYLKAGANSLSFQVWHWGNTGGQNNDSGSGGLIVSTGLVDTATGKTVSTGDGAWQALKSPAYSADSQATHRLLYIYNNIYDARNEIDWKNPDYSAFEADGWAAAAEYGPAGSAPWKDLYARPYPQWKDHGVKTLPWDKYEGAPAGTQRYRLTLPYNCQFVPYIELGPDTPAGIAIRMYSETYGSSQERLTYVTKAGAQSYEGQAWINGDWLFFEIPDELAESNVVSLGFRETGYPVAAGEHGKGDFLGYFDSAVAEDEASVVGQDGYYPIAPFTGGHTWDNAWSAEGPSADNNFYDELWKKAVRTLYVTMRDGYMDCPDRERGQYIGDAVNEFEEAYYSLGTDVNALTRKTYAELFGWQWEFQRAGRTYYGMSNVRPGKLNQEIYTQTLTGVYSLATYYLFTGDAELVRNVWQKAYNYLLNWDLEATGDYAGTLQLRPADTTPPGYNTLSEWCDWGDNQDKRVLYNLFYYMAATTVQNLANEVEGVAMSAEQESFLAERLATLRANFEKFWNEEQQAYVTPRTADNWGGMRDLANGTHDVDDRPNAIAVVAGLCPPERYPAVRELLMGGGGVHADPHENTSIYLEKYAQEALYLMGYDKDAMQRMARRHMHLINNNIDSSIAEHWRGRPIGTGTGTTAESKNHGWSGGSMIAMSRRAAGVEPTAPGYASWRVIPQTGAFLKIDMRVPAIIGDIDVALLRDADDGLSMTVRSPGNDAQFLVPLADGQSAWQVSGPATEYLGLKQEYGKTYAAYAASEAGEYAFKAAPTAVGVTAADRTAFGDAAEFVFVAADMKTVNLIDVTFTADAARLGTAEAKLTALNGFEVFGEGVKWTDLGNGRAQGNFVLGAMSGKTVSDTAEVAKLSFGASKLGAAGLTITAVEVFGIDESGGSADSSERASVIDPATAETLVWSVYDVNGDNAVNHADLSLGFYYYLSKADDANWANAKAADVNGSGAVDITDLLAIYANYIAA